MDGEMGDRAESLKKQRSDEQSIMNKIKVKNPVLLQFQSGQMLKIGPRQGTGLILCKSHHAELAGWGAAVGGISDLDVRQVIPIGEFSLDYPESYEERKKAYQRRKKWFDALMKVTSNPVPLKRAIGILNLLEKTFGLARTINISDEILAQLVGVLPSTMAIARQSGTRFQWSEKEQKTNANQKIITVGGSGKEMER